MTFSTFIKEGVNRKLRDFGLSLVGASISNNTLWVSLDTGCSATINGNKVADILMGIFETNTVVMDGAVYTKA